MKLPQIKLQQRERILCLMIMLALPAAYFSLVHRSQSQQVKALEESVLAEETKLQAKLATLNELQSKVALAQVSNSTNSEVKRYIEANRYMSNLLRKLGADEEHRGMTLKNIAIAKNEKMNNFHRSTMKVEIESSFISLGKFLGALSESEALLEVTSVVLNRIDTDLKRCTATIEVFGYYNEGPKL